MDNQDLDARYESIVSSLEQLPTLPAVLYWVLSVVNNPLITISQVEKAVEKDQSLTLKVLKLANSAYYAIPGGASNLARALTFLGTNTIQQLVVSAAIFDKLEVESCPEFNVRQFWLHSLGTAIAAEKIGARASFQDTSSLFVAGLVHDMGKLILFKFAREEWLSICRGCQKNGFTSDHAEDLLGFRKHARCGYLLAKRWKLPELMKFVILNHHQEDPAKRGAGDPGQNQAADIVLMANRLVHALHFGHSGHDVAEPLPKPVLRRLMIEESMLPTIIDEIRKSLEKAESFINALMMPT